MPTQEVEEIHPGQEKVEEGWELKFPRIPLWDLSFGLLGHKGKYGPWPWFP